MLLWWREAPCPGSLLEVPKCSQRRLIRHFSGHDIYKCYNQKPKIHSGTQWSEANTPEGGQKEPGTSFLQIGPGPAARVSSVTKTAWEQPALTSANWTELNRSEARLGGEGTGIWTVWLLVLQRNEVNSEHWKWQVMFSLFLVLFWAPMFLEAFKFFLIHTEKVTY